jgi:hypothetical protein
MNKPYPLSLSALWPSGNPSHHPNAKETLIMSMDFSKNKGFQKLKAQFSNHSLESLRSILIHISFKEALTKKDAYTIASIFHILKGLPTKTLAKKDAEAKSDCLFIITRRLWVMPLAF